MRTVGRENPIGYVDEGVFYTKFDAVPNDTLLRIRDMNARYVSLRGAVAPLTDVVRHSRVRDRWWILHIINKQNETHSKQAD